MRLVIEEVVNWMGEGYSYFKNYYYFRKYFLSFYDRYSLVCIIIIIFLNILFRLGYVCLWVGEM